MNLEELVNQNYDLLTANDREMVGHIFRDKKLVRDMNSMQLASFLHVSRTTLVRLMKKLGIHTYPEFKILLDAKREETGMTETYDLQDIMKEYHFMVDNIAKNDYESICKSVYASDTVYLYGSGNEQKTIAEEFKRIFTTLGKCCIELFDLGEVEFAAERIQENDIFFAISLSGENKEAIEIIKRVQKFGIRTISLTRWNNNSLARICHDNLYVGTKTISHSSGHPYEMVAAFYILLDVLSIRYLEYTQEAERRAADER